MVRVINDFLRIQAEKIVLVPRSSVAVAMVNARSMYCNAFSISLTIRILAKGWFDDKSDNVGPARTVM